jgi:hypothetical protein
MKKFIVNGFKSLNWSSIVIPGIILSLELLIKSLMKSKEEKRERYSAYSQQRLM